MVTRGHAAVGGGNNFKLLAALVNPGSQSNEVLEGSFSTACSISSMLLMFRTHQGFYATSWVNVTVFEPSPAITGESRHDIFWGHPSGF